jgi:hypothetical protein
LYVSPLIKGLLIYKHMNYVKGDFILVPNKLAIKGLQPSDQAVFMWICSYVNDEGWCFPSRSRLAKDCGVSVKTVDRAMERIIEKGLMTKQIRKKGEKNLSNIYQVLIVENNGVVELCRQGGDKNDTGTIVSINQSQERTAAQSIAENWWNAYKTRTGGKTPTGKGAWHALIAVADGALKSGWTEQQVTEALMQCSVPSAVMLDIQLNKLIATPTATMRSEPVQKRRLPRIAGDAGCVQCEGSGVFSVFNDADQQWQSKKCGCYTESFL